MSDELKEIFKLPRSIRRRMVEGTRDAGVFLENAELLKKLGLMSEKDEGDMKTLIEMGKRIEAITSEIADEEVPEK